MSTCHACHVDDQPAKTPASYPHCIGGLLHCLRHFNAAPIMLCCHQPCSNDQRCAGGCSSHKSLAASCSAHVSLQAALCRAVNSRSELLHGALRSTTYLSAKSKVSFRWEAAFQSTGTTRMLGSVLHHACHAAPLTPPFPGRAFSSLDRWKQPGAFRYHAHFQRTEPRVGKHGF